VCALMLWISGRMHAPYAVEC